MHIEDAIDVLGNLLPLVQLAHARAYLAEHDPFLGSLETFDSNVLNIGFVDDETERAEAIYGGDSDLGDVALFEVVLLDAAGIHANAPLIGNVSNLGADLRS